MKIISSFRDYYDGAVGYDTDKSRLYLRKPVENELTDLGDSPLRKWVDFLHSIPKPMFAFAERPMQAHHLLLGFCGELHLLHQFQRRIYFRDEYEAFCDRLRSSQERRPNYSSWLRKSWEESKISAVKKYRDYLRVHAHRFSSDEPFLHIDAPCFVIQYDLTFGAVPTLITNPRLLDYDLQKKVDSYQAYQEIEMYLGNQLAKQVDPSSHFSDELKAHAHGFDEWSFRQPPPGAKKLRRARKKKPVRPKGGRSRF